MRRSTLTHLLVICLLLGSGQVFAARDLAPPTFSTELRSLEADLRRNSDDHGLRRRLIKEYLRLGNKAQAIPHLETLQAAKQWPDETRDLLVEAHSRLGQWNKAELVVLQQLNEQPNNPMLYLALGRMAQAQGKLDEARKNLRMALLLDENSNRTTLLKEDRVRIHVRLGQVALGSADYPQVRKHIEDARRENPDSLLPLRLTACLALETRRYQDGIAALAEATILAPDDWTVQWDLARVQALAHDVTGARTTTSRLLDRQPNRSAEILAASLSWAEQDYPTAYRGVALLCEQPDAHPLLLSLKADLERLLGEEEAAAQTWRRLLTNANGLAQAGYVELAALHLSADRLSEALSVLREGQASKGERSLVYRMAYQLLKDDAPFETVEALFTEWLTAQPEAIEGYLTRVRYLMEQRLYHEALGVYNLIPEGIQHTAESYYLQGLLHWELNNPNGAVIALDKAIRADMESATARDTKKRLTDLVARKEAPTEKTRIEELITQERLKEALREVKLFLVEKPGDPWATALEQDLSERLMQRHQQQLQESLLQSRRQRVTALRSRIEELRASHEYLEALLLLEDLQTLSQELPDLAATLPSLRDTLQQEHQAHVASQIAARIEAKDAPSSKQQGAQPAPGVGQWLERHPLAALGLGLGVMLLGVVLGVVLWGRRREEVQHALEQVVLDSEVLSGRISLVNFINFLQFLHQEGRSGAVELRSGEVTGTILFVHGNIDNAWVGDLSGVEALHALLDWEEGSFTFQARDVEPSRSIRESVQHLLLRYVCEKDEREREREEAQNSAGQSSTGVDLP